MARTPIVLDGAHVLVTGASRGIGAALAASFAARGASVTLAARPSEHLERQARKVGGRAMPVDLADPAQLDGFVARVEALGGPLDVVVNNAGVETAGLADRVGEHAIAEVAAVNLVAPQRLVRQVLPGMLERRRGHLVGVSSLAGVVVVPGSSVYSASKAALTHYMAGVTADLRGAPIGTTVVEVGLVRTELADRFRADPDVFRATERARRLGLYPATTPERVAEATVAAVAAGRRHVRLPRRLAGQYLLDAAPRRLLDLLLAGQRPRR